MLLQKYYTIDTMKISFTNHAKYRIDERNISILHIENTLKNPDYIKRNENEILVRKSFGKKMLEVVYKQTIKSVVVITAYYIQS